MSLEKAKKYLESKGCLNWKKCATPRAGWMCANKKNIHCTRKEKIVNGNTTN